MQCKHNYLLVYSACAIMPQNDANSLDPTFRNYTAEQAETYERNRGLPSSGVFEEILRFHAARGGQLDTALGVGCGTGQATRSLARYFPHVVGVDPGDRMIAQARRLGGNAQGGKPIEYEVLGAEELDSSSVILPASVDLLTSQMAVGYLS